MNNEYAFLEETQKDWELETLYKDLGGDLPPITKTYLRGLLLGYTAAIIGGKLNLAQNTVAVGLSTELKEPLEALLKSKKVTPILYRSKKNKSTKDYFPWAQTKELLKEAGYYKLQPKRISEPIKSDSLLYYIERPEIETLCLQVIRSSAGIVRIKAPWRMGKTSLIYKILEEAKQEELHTVILKFSRANNEVFTDFYKVLRWFCFSVVEELDKLGLKIELRDGLEDDLNGTANKELAYKYFFEKEILQRIPKALVLSLDDIDQLNRNPEVADGFLDLLRGWNQQAIHNSSWRKLRLVLAYSNRISIKDLESSPFNVGQAIPLEEFKESEVINLAKLYQLDWGIAEASKLMNIVGGYPCLVRLALDCISSRRITPTEFLENKIYKEIYEEYLHDLLDRLERSRELAVAMKKVVDGNDSVQLNRKLVDQLYNMGLIKPHENGSIPRCQLFREYFQESLEGTL